MGSLNLTKLKPNSTYIVQVRAVGLDGSYSNYSNTYTFTTPSTGILTTNSVANTQLSGGSMYAGNINPFAIDSTASGTIFNKDGIFGYNSGSPTFYVTSSAGNAYFAGLLAATTGSIGGWLISSNQLNSTQGTGKNLFSNYDPSFESSGIINGLNYWTAQGGLNATLAKSTTAVQDGTFSARVSSRNPAPDVPDSQITSVLIPTLNLLTSGSSYTFSGYVRANVSNGNPSAQIVVNQYDTNQSLISSTTGSATAMSGWTRTSASFTAASNIAYVGFVVVYYTDQTYTVTGNFVSAYYDAMQLEAGTSATTYEFSSFTGLYGTTSSTSQYKIKFGLAESSNPSFSVDIFGTTQSRNLLIGTSLSSQNLYFDSQSLQSQYNASAATLYLNKTLGGNLNVGGNYTASITSYSITANTVTVTIANTSNLRIGDPIAISGTTPTSGTSIDGNYYTYTSGYKVLSIPTKTTFTFSHPSVSSGTGSGGNITDYYASDLTLNGNANIVGNIAANNGYIIINGTKVNLGGTITVSSGSVGSVAASAITGTTLASNVVNSSLVTFGASPTFTGTVNLGSSIATGSVQYASSAGFISASNVSGSVASALNSASLSGQPGSYYYPASSISTASVAYATNAGNASTATNATNLGGIDSSNYARLDISNTFSPGNIFTATTISNGKTMFIQGTASSNRLLTAGDDTGAGLTNGYFEIRGPSPGITDASGFPLPIAAISAKTQSAMKINTVPSTASPYPIFWVTNEGNLQNQTYFAVYTTGVNLGSNVATGSVNSALNSASLAGQPGSYYYPASSISTASVAYATNSGNSTTTSQTNFTTLSVSGSANFLGGILTSPTASSVVGLQLKMYATSPGNALEVYSPTSSTVATNINSSGQMGIRSFNNLYGAALAINSANDSIKGVVVRSNSASQSVNLQEWQNASGSAIASVSPSGVMTAASFVGNGSGLTGITAAANISLTDTSSAANFYPTFVPATGTTSSSLYTASSIFSVTPNNVQVNINGKLAINYNGASTFTASSQYSAAATSNQVANIGLLMQSDGYNSGGTGTVTGRSIFIRTNSADAGLGGIANAGAIVIDGGGNLPTPVANSVIISSLATGTINNMTIGNVTPASAKFTSASLSGTVTAASFSGNGSAVTGVVGLYNAGTLVAEATSGKELTLHRVNSASEGGQLNFNRAFDDGTGWYIDLFGTASTTPTMRWVDSTSNVRMSLDSTGLTVASAVAATNQPYVVSASSAAQQKIQSGTSASISVSGNNSNVTGTVTFPAAFGTAPVVMATLYGSASTTGANGAAVAIFTYGIGTASFGYDVRNTSTTAWTGSVQWIAIGT